MAAYLDIAHLKRAFDRVSALDDFSLQAGPGEFIVVVGPSGCGKSTLLRILAGLERAQSGQVVLDGRDITNLPAQKRDIAMVFQDYAIYPHLTVAGNLSFPLEARKMPKADREIRIKEVAEKLALTPLLNAWPRTLSGGQRQRVAVGRAWVRDPKLFLYDEPLSNLDAALRSELRRELLELKSTVGVTSLYVTHDQVEALTLADQVVVLEGGHLRMAGAPKEVYERPVHRFVATFLGQPQMKLLSMRRTASGWEEARPDEQGPGVFQVGVRPESWRPGAGAFQVQTKVLCKEFIGNATVVTLQTLGGQTFLVTADGHGKSESATWCADLSALHVFDPVTGLRVEAV